MKADNSRLPAPRDHSSRPQTRSEHDAVSTLMAWRYLAALVLVSLTGTQSFAKGGSLKSEDRYNPQHIESLPPGIHDAVNHQCGTPKALHDFASYTDNLQKVVLHFEHFYCNAGGPFCGPSGCLHQVYVSSHGHYRLLRSYYAPAGE
jgi:hypothetical protein